MTIIQVAERPFDWTSRDVYAEVAEVLSQDGPLASDREIHPAAAIAIASWWQSPGTVGHVLASFASNMPVNHEELLSDISRTRPEAKMAQDRQALDCLSTFVIQLARANRSKGE